MSKSRRKAPPSAFLGVNAAAALTSVYFRVNAAELKERRVKVAQPTIIGRDEIESVFLSFLRSVREIAAALKKEADT